MDSKRIATREILQKVVTLTKHAYDLHSATNLTVPTWSNHLYRQSSPHSEAHFSHSPTIPTYLLAPQRKFDFSRARRIFQHELNRRCSRVLPTHRYQPKQALDFVRELSYQLRRIIRRDQLQHNRYKLVVMATIVQTAPDRQMHQSMSIASRCLWDSQTDGSITVQAPLGYDMCVIAMAYAVYTE